MHTIKLFSKNIHAHVHTYTCMMHVYKYIMMYIILQSSIIHISLPWTSIHREYTAVDLWSNCINIL